MGFIMIVSCEFGFFFFFWLSERGWQQEDTAAAGLQIQINQSIVLLNSSWFHLTENPSDVMFFKKKNCTNFKHFPAFLRCNLPFIIHLYVRDLLRYQTDSTYLFGWACVYL